MLKKSLLSKVKNLPNKTGVYLFMCGDVFLYIGKSNNIRSRVLSYFRAFSKKNEVLTSLSTGVDYFLVDNEKDALFLENNLIKKHKPRYNILLKDDKSFPWVCIKNERFPRVFITRKKTSDSDFYFGPYTSRRSLNELFSVIKDFYPIRSCNYSLSKKNIFSKKFSVCLDYHLKKCLGPCEGLQSEKDYNKKIFIIKSILEGRFSVVLRCLKKDLLMSSESLLFEKCEKIKNQINNIKSLKKKSVIVFNKNIDIDSFFIISLNNYSYINYIKIREGCVVYINNYKIKNPLFFDEKYILKNFIKSVFFNYKNISKNIISNILVSGFLNKKITVPKKGYKKNVLNLGFKNLVDFIKSNKSIKSFSLLSDLKKDLFLKKTPLIIDCFDVSNLCGTNTTASCVCFKNGKPFKSEYRSFIIKKTVGIDDYLSLSEAIEKKYNNFNNYIPDLIIVDGGKGQLKIVLKTLKKLNISGINVISIAKKNEIIYLNNFKEIILNNNNSSLKLIQFIRNEAHRFCLKHHRIRRNLSFISSELNNIKGVGNKTIFKLLNKFKSLNKIKYLSKDELVSFLGLKKGIIIYEHLKK